MRLLTTSYRLGLKRRSVLVMIVIFIATLGLYFPVWFLRRRGALNRLDSPTELRMWPFLMYGGYFVLEFITAFMAEFAAGSRQRQRTRHVCDRPSDDHQHRDDCAMLRREEHPGRPSGRAGRCRFVLERGRAGEALRTHDVLFPHLLLTMGHKPLYRRQTTRGVHRRYDLKRAYSVGRLLESAGSLATIDDHSH